MYVYTQNIKINTNKNTHTNINTNTNAVQQKVDNDDDEEKYNPRAMMSTSLILRFSTLYLFKKLAPKVVCSINLTFNYPF